MISDYDGAWKDLLHTHFSECLECYFPLVAEAIDWCHAPIFLDQELKELAITDESTGNRVDILVEVRLLTGRRQLVHLHMEVQSAYEEGLCRTGARVFPGDMPEHGKGCGDPRDIGRSECKVETAEL